MAPGAETQAAVNVAEHFESGSVVYISAINGGTCITLITNSNLLHQTAASASDSQYWAIEYEGDKPDKIAFRHCATGRYMKTTGGRGYNRIKIGDNENDKTWWQVLAGRAPGTYSFKATDQTNAYMCNQQGRNNDGAQCYVWPWEDGWWYSMMWHLKAAPGYKGKGVYDEKAKFVKAGPGWEEADQKYTAMQKEIEQLKSKPAASADDSEVKKREQDVARREQELKDTAAREQQETQRREQELASKERDLKALEARLAEREKDIRNSDSSGSQTQTANGGGGDSALQAKMDELQRSNNTLRQELEQARKAAQSSSVRPSTGDTLPNGTGVDGNTDSRDALAKENTQLKAELEKLTTLNLKLQGVQDGTNTSGSGMVTRNFPAFDPKLMSKHSLGGNGDGSGTYNISTKFNGKLLAFDQKLISPFAK